jgi:TonB family protein
MKYCDKCGSTYPAQFNVCPIDTSPLRFTSDPAPAAARETAPEKDKKVEAAAVGVVAAATATAKQAGSTKAAKAASDSAKAEFAELRDTIRHRTEDEPVVVEEPHGTDWQAMLRDKNWHALAANPVVLAGATLILVLLVGGIVWKAHRSHASTDSVKAMEKAPEQPAANSQSSGIVPNSSAQPLDASLSTQAQAKPADTTAAAKQNPKDAQQKPANQPDNNTPRPAQVLSLPMPAQRDPNGAKREVAANEPIEPPSSIPGALPNTAPNTLGSIAKDVPVAVPTLSAQKLRVSSGVAQAQITHQVTPQYPPEALQSRVHGTVVLQAVIGKDGNVKNLKVVSGPTMLVKSATEAVKQWRYRPFTLNGEPVEADTQINVNFNLGEQ